MASSLSNLAQRIITGILGSAGIIAAIYFSDWTYFAVFFLICLLSLFEFYKLAGLDGLAPPKSIGVLTGMLIFVGSFLIEKNILEARYYFFDFPIDGIGIHDQTLQEV